MTKLTLHDPVHFFWNQLQLATTILQDFCHFKRIIRDFKGASHFPQKSCKNGEISSEGAGQGCRANYGGGGFFWKWYTGNNKSILETTTHDRDWLYLLFALWIINRKTESIAITLPDSTNYQLQWASNPLLSIYPLFPNVHGIHLSRSYGLLKWLIYLQLVDIYLQYSIDSTKGFLSHSKLVTAILQTNRQHLDLSFIWFNRNVH